MTSDLATSTIDEARKDAFCDRLVEVLNDGALGFMISIGHRTDLFDAMDGLAPSTSEQIAQAAGCHERYVREWLGAMVTGGVVEHDRETGRYVGDRYYKPPPNHPCSWRGIR